MCRIIRPNNVVASQSIHWKMRKRLDSESISVIQIFFRKPSRDYKWTYFWLFELQELNIMDKTKIKSQLITFSSFISRMCWLSYTKFFTIKGWWIYIIDKVNKYRIRWHLSSVTVICNYSKNATKETQLVHRQLWLYRLRFRQHLMQVTKLNEKSLT